MVYLSGHWDNLQTDFVVIASKTQLFLHLQFIVSIDLDLANLAAFWLPCFEAYDYADFDKVFLRISTNAKNSQKDPLFLRYEFTIKKTSIAHI